MVFRLPTQRTPPLRPPRPLHFEASLARPCLVALVQRLLEVKRYPQASGRGSGFGTGRCLSHRGLSTQTHIPTSLGGGWPTCRGTRPRHSGDEGTGSRETCILGGFLPTPPPACSGTQGLCGLVYERMWRGHPDKESISRASPFLQVWLISSSDLISC